MRELLRGPVNLGSGEDADFARLHGDGVKNKQKEDNGTRGSRVVTARRINTRTARPCQDRLVSVRSAGASSAWFGGFGFAVPAV